MEIQIEIRTPRVLIAILTELPYVFMAYPIACQTCALKYLFTFDNNTAGVQKYYLCIFILSIYALFVVVVLIINDACGNFTPRVRASSPFQSRIMGILKKTIKII